MRAALALLGLFIGCGGDAAGPFADWQWIAGERDSITLTDEGADIELGRYGSVWLTLRRDAVPSGTWASIQASFRTTCPGITGNLWVAAGAAQDKRHQLDSVGLRAAGYVRPTFYFQAVTMNSSPASCRVRISAVSVGER
jgi:hypothetical protein